MAMLLNLVEIDAHMEQSLLWRLFSPFERELRLRDGTREEAMQKAADPGALIRRYGLARVTAFYEEQLLPTLRRLPNDWPTWRARNEVEYQLLQLHAHGGDLKKALALAAELTGNLAPARGSGNQQEEMAVRRQLRTALAPLVAAVAGELSASGQDAKAIYGYQTLDRLGGLEARWLAKYVVLLWRTQDSSPAALRLYLRHLNDCDWDLQSAPHLPELVGHVKLHLHIDEETPREDLPRRLWLNQMALSAPGLAAWAAHNIGLGYWRLNQPNRSIEYLRRAHAASDGDGGAAGFYLGQALFKTGEFAEASEVFAQAAERGFSRSRIASSQALAYAQTGLWDEALRTFREAESLLGEGLDSEFYLQWGRASFLMQNAGEGALQFRRAWDQDKNNWRAQYGLAICKERLGQRADAIALLWRLAAQDEHAKIGAPAHMLGRLLEAEGLMDEALASYKKAVERRSQDMEFQLSLGLAFTPGVAESLPHLEQAARAGAGGPEVIRRLMLGCLQMAERKQARHYLQVLATDYPFSEGVAPYHSRDLASQATESFNEGDYQAAVKLWEQAVAALPDDPRAGERMAAALLADAAARLRRGQVGGVAECIGRASRFTPNAHTQFLSGLYCLVSGDFVASRNHFSALSAQHPGDDDYRYFDHLTTLLAVDDETLANCTKVAEAGKGPLGEVLAGMQYAFLEVINPFLAGPPARLEDDLPWPPPPASFTPELEPLEKAILRDQ